MPKEGNIERTTEKSSEKKRKREYKGHWKEIYFWLEHDASNDVTYFMVCRNYPKLADITKNDKACRDFVENIAAVEKERSQEEIENGRFLCVLADGSTEKSITEQGSRFMFAVQDPTGTHPLTLQTLFLLHLLMPLVLLLQFRKVFKL